MAVAYSPLYLEENGDAIRNDWPRVPLPINRDELITSARLGQRIADLLDITTSLTGATHVGHRSIARITRVDNRPIAPQGGDLSVTARWATVQTRRQKSGATSRIVMPGRGHVEPRARTGDEGDAYTAEELELLGEGVVDVYLNDRVCWRGVPEAVWDFKIGGFQVLRKWLSYRDRTILRRDLNAHDVRQFTDICQRISDLILLGPELDANYKAATGFSS